MDMNMLTEVVILCTVISAGWCHIYKPVLQGTYFELHCSYDKNSESSAVMWSKNGKSLKNWTNQLTYHVDNAQVNDSGIYQCNNSGVINSTEVAVGNVPEKPPRAECFESRNVLIRCEVGPLENVDGRSIKVCIIAVGYPVPTKNCTEKPRRVTIIYDLTDNLEFTIDIQTIVTNEFGTGPMSSVEIDMLSKVRPDPPRNVMVVATGTDSFNVSFQKPATWITGTPTWYWYDYNKSTETGFTLTATDDKHYFAGISDQFTQVVSDIGPYSLVCWRFWISYSTKKARASDASETKCQRTKMAAPSRAPSSFTKTELQNSDAPELRSVIFNWKAPAERYHNGIIDRYVLTLVTIESDTNETVQYNISANVTSYKVYDLDSYVKIHAKIKACTEGGASDERVIELLAISLENNAAFGLLFKILIAVTVFVIIVAIIMCSGVMLIKLKTSRVPEPKRFPLSTMLFLQSLKPSASIENEMFDDLKCKANEEKKEEPLPNNADTESEKLQLLSSPSNLKEEDISTDTSSSHGRDDVSDYITGDQ